MADKGGRDKNESTPATGGEAADVQTSGVRVATPMTTKEARRMSKLYRRRSPVTRHHRNKLVAYASNREVSLLNFHTRRR